MKSPLAPFSQLLRLVVLCAVLMTLSLQQAHGTSLSSRLSALLSDTPDEILPPDEAFQASVSVQSPTLLRADFFVAPGHYLYKERLGFELLSADGGIARVDLPQGEPKDDPTFGQTEVYYNGTTALIHLAEGSRFPLELRLSYQGCNARGLCYAPIHQVVNLAAVDAAAPMAAPPPVAAPSDSAESLLRDGRPWLIVAGFFGFGLLLSLTPCVLPMIPVLSGIIVGGRQFGRWHTFNLSLAYTLGMALTYTLMGIAAGLSGQMLNTLLQNAWALGFGAAVFVLLALSMFGFYELRLPGALENRVADLSRRIKGGRFFGVLLMGVLSALLLSPCVAAPLAAALLYISQTRDVVLGGTALFALSMGMGVPLLLLGASAGSLLPKAGAWMTAIRQFFGVVMLAVALWLVSPLLPAALLLLLWAALLIVPAMYLHALDALPPGAHPWLRFWKGIGVLMLVLGVLLVIGAASGARSPLQPLAALQIGVGSGQNPANARLPFQRVESVAELDRRLGEAAGRPVMLDFYADWCVACKELEAYTFSDARVQAALRDTVLLQADVTRNTEQDAALLKRFKLYGPPGIIFFDAGGNELAQPRVIGFQDAEQFLATLTRLQP